MHKSRFFPPLWILPTLVVVIVAAFYFWRTSAEAPSVQAAAKVIQVELDVFEGETTEAAVRDLFLEDPTAQALMLGGNKEFVHAVPLNPSESRAWDGCGLSRCAHILFYDYDRGGTIEAIMNLATGRVIETWADPGTRPVASEFTLETALDIAKDDPEVQALLGDITTAELMMVPMNIWLLDDACRTDWCVDLTYHDPAGSGKILHVTVNLEEEKVARTFYTRGRPSFPYRDFTPQRDVYSDGCHDQGGWSVCWAMTANDGVEFYDAVYEGRSVFKSAKIGQVEVFYPSWPGGYRDEIGFSASVPPYFDTRLEEVENGFKVSQLFTEFERWPNCICCYRYEQTMVFFDDGAFEAQLLSHGPGCDDLSVYQPMWRIDLDLKNPENDEAWIWDDREWVEINRENEFEMVLDNDLSPEGHKLATFDGDLHYRWSYITSDPLGLDEAKLFMLQNNELEGENPILTGPSNSFQPPRQWIDGDPVSGEDLVLWYVPLLKTKKGGPWYCMPDPGPDGVPCTSILRAEPAGDLPSAEELATLLDEMEEAEPEIEEAPAAIEEPETPVEGAPAETSPQVIEGGINAEALILNSGCAACHVIGNIGDHGKVGPDLTNLSFEAANRIPGMPAREYIRRSIIYPNEYIVEECPNGPCLANVMPLYYGERLNALQIELMIDYLEGVEPILPIVAESDLPTPEAEDAVVPVSTLVAEESQPSLMIWAILAACVTAAAGLGYLIGRRGSGS